jgi:hypothetical protein
MESVEIKYDRIQIGQLQIPIKVLWDLQPPPAERSDRGVLAGRRQIADPATREAEVAVLRARYAAEQPAWRESACLFIVAQTFSVIVEWDRYRLVQYILGFALVLISFLGGFTAFRIGLVIWSAELLLAR